MNIIKQLNILHFLNVFSVYDKRSRDLMQRKCGMIINNIES